MEALAPVETRQQKRPERVALLHLPMRRVPSLLPQLYTLLLEQWAVCRIASQKRLTSRGALAQAPALAEEEEAFRALPLCRSLAVRGRVRLGPRPQWEPP